jgi:hypothetical protein
MMRNRETPKNWVENMLKCYFVNFESHLKLPGTGPELGLVSKKSLFSRMSYDKALCLYNGQS